MEIAVVGIYLPVRARRQVGIGVGIGIGIEYSSHASIPIPIATPTPIETNPIESDAQSGKFEFLAKEALDEYRSGKANEF